MLRSKSLFDVRSALVAGLALSLSACGPSDIVSINQGEVDLDALIAGKPQQVNSNKNGSFALYRIGDALASRNIHTALYDALRLCSTI